MTQIRWDKMSEREIRNLIEQGEKEISRRQVVKKKDAKQKLAAVAREFGFRLDELVEGGVRATRSRSTEPKEVKAKLPPKYRNPADHSQTWSGHGKRPMWAKSHLESGGELSDLLIRRGRAPRAPAIEKPTRAAAKSRAPRKTKATA